MALFCSQCGVENHQDAVTCYHCQSPIARPVYGAGQHHGHHSGGQRTYEGEVYEGEVPGDAAYTNADSGSKPRSQFGLGSIVIAGICALYMVYPSFGVFELIPDNMPIIGNLDEAAAMTGLLMALSNLGIIPYRRT